jgi:hypothetical protein
MPNISLRRQNGINSPEDLVVTVQDATFAYLMESPATEIRVSAYLDRDWAKVEPSYAEIFVAEECPFYSKIIRVMPGSRTRKNIVLPGEMKEGEQLVVVVKRTPIAQAGEPETE